MVIKDGDEVSFVELETLPLSPGSLARLGWASPLLPLYHHRDNLALVSQICFFLPHPNWVLEGKLGMGEGARTVCKPGEGVKVFNTQKSKGPLRAYLVCIN